MLPLRHSMAENLISDAGYTRLESVKARVKGELQGHMYMYGIGVRAQICCLGDVTYTRLDHTIKS